MQLGGVSDSAVAATHVIHTDYGTGFDRFVEMTLYAPYPTHFRYYIIRRKVGSPNGSAGNWEGLSSTTVHQDQWGSMLAEEWLFCHHEYADPILYQQASLAMASDPMHCDDGPATDCYGAHRGRLPLEDELIDDSDPYENSFRHHIRVAREAADHADFLGQQLIEAGLRMDSRAELAAANLADLCGGEINLDGLFNPDGSTVVPNLDQVVTDTPCGPGYVELGDRCILDIINRATLNELENVRLWAERIGWRGYPMNMSELTIDGGRWHGTGNPFPDFGGSGYATDDWPCVGSGESCTGDETSLFCSVASCLDNNSRAAFNDRLARAAVTLGIMSGYGLGNLRLPVRYGSTVGQVDFYEHSGRWEAADLSGLVTIPLAESPPIVWTRVATDADPLLHSGSTPEHPVAFINFGRAQRDEAAASQISESFWTGMTLGRGRSSTAVGFAPHSTERFEDAAGGRGFLRLAIDGEEVVLTNIYPSRNGWLTNYWREHVYGINAEPDGGTGFRDNILLPARNGLRARDALDAMELMCEAARAAEEEDFCDPSRPPAIQTAADLPQLRSYLRCIANRVQRMGEQMVLQNVPRRAIDIILNEPGAVRPDDGAYGRDVIRLRDELRVMAAIPRSIAGQVNEFADDLEILEHALGDVEARRELQNLSAVSGVLSQVAACASAAGSGNSAGGVATCANSAAQIVIQFRMNEINQALLTSGQQQLLIQFRTNFAQRQALLASLSDQILSTSEAINTSLTNLRANRRAAARSLAGALFASSDAGDRHYHVNTVMRRNYNTLRERYEEAHRAAIQYADLARRSLEQRLGTDLATLDLSLVDDPGALAMGICQSSGINYARIRDETEIEMESYADAFVGDYVRRLERVLESYRLDYPYTSAADTAVISVRDDLWTIREQCPAPTFNLLAASGDLSQGVEPLPGGGIPTAEDGVAPNPAWDHSGCIDLDVAPDVELIENCVTANAVSDAGMLSIDAIDPTHRGDAFRVAFAPGTGDSFDAGADWGQSLPLGPSVYRLSWYGREVDDGTNRAPDTALDLTVQGSSGPVTVVSSPTLSTTTADPEQWTRYFRFFSFDEGGTARVRILPATAVSTSHAVDIAAVQLEWVGDRVFAAVSGIDQTDADGHVALYYPRPFVETTSYETAELMVCADEDGDRFRRRWAYRCVSGHREADLLCPAA